MESFFNPRSIAIVGASRSKGKVGHELLAALVAGNYPGKLFPINPKAEEIAGLKCFTDLEAIGETPELVLVAVVADLVPRVIQEVDIDLAQPSENAVGYEIQLVAR